jgi:cell division protein FtsW (lipid II flippase)
VNWYPKRDTEWYPQKPTVGQAALGAMFFLALAGLAIFWTAGEPDAGNRIFLLVMAGLMLTLAAWRIAIVFRLVHEGRRRRRAIRGL